MPEDKNLKRGRIWARMKTLNGDEIRGYLYTTEGYRGRLSDIIHNNEQDFLLLSNVEIKEFDGLQLHLNFACVNKRNLVWIYPIEEIRSYENL